MGWPKSSYELSGQPNIYHLLSMPSTLPPSYFCAHCLLPLKSPSVISVPLYTPIEVLLIFPILDQIPFLLVAFSAAHPFCHDFLNRGFTDNNFSWLI